MNTEIFSPLVELLREKALNGSSERKVSDESFERQISVLELIYQCLRAWAFKKSTNSRYRCGGCWRRCK